MVRFWVGGREWVSSGGGVVEFGVSGAIQLGLWCAVGDLYNTQWCLVD